MKPAPFVYLSPRTVDEALNWASEFGDEQKLLAGGQSLVPMMNMRLARPERLIDLNRIPDLDQIRWEGDRLVIGPLARQRTVERSSTVLVQSPLLAEALTFVAHSQIRNRGTIAGSLAHADPSAEIGMAWLALDGTLTARSVRGERTIASREFFISSFMTALEADEMITSVSFGALPASAGYGFQEVAKRHGDFAMVAAAAVIIVDRNIVTRARIVLGSVADKPFRLESAEELLVGEAPNDSIFENVADLVTAEIRPTGDIHASVDYRRRVAGVLTRRALVQARDRLFERAV